MKLTLFPFLIPIISVLAQPPQKPFLTDPSSLKLDEKLALNKLQEYLKIDTSHPKPNYKESSDFLLKYSKELDLKYSIFMCSVDKPPTVILSWKGTKDLGSIILNSHTDVVPVVKENWIFDPFNATLAKDKHGYDSIYGRGSQDTKSLGIMYLEAIRSLKQNYPNGPDRTVHILFVPDEEIGGTDGLKCFAKSKDWNEIIGEVELVLDEGFISADKSVRAFYAERFQSGFKITARGTAGHASQFIQNLATDKLSAFQAKIRAYRHREERRMLKEKLSLGEVTTVNLDLLKAGTAMNVVPDTVEAWFDMRVSPKTDFIKLKSQLNQWATKSNVTLEFVAFDQPYSTDLKKLSKWKALKDTAKLFGMPLAPEIFPAATDSRHLRKLGYNAIGLTPVNNHPALPHANDEYLRLSSFYTAIKFYIKVLPQLIN